MTMEDMYLAKSSSVEQEPLLFHRGGILGPNWCWVRLIRKNIRQLNDIQQRRVTEVHCFVKPTTKKSNWLILDSFTLCHQTITVLLELTPRCEEAISHDFQRRSDHLPALEPPYIYVIFLMAEINYKLAAAAGGFTFFDDNPIYHHMVIKLNGYHPAMRCFIRKKAIVYLY